MATYYEKVEQRITKAVKELINDPRNEEKLYELLMCGHVAYTGGLGLPHESVHEAIRKGVGIADVDHDHVSKEEKYRNALISIRDYKSDGYSDYLDCYTDLKFLASEGLQD